MKKICLILISISFFACNSDRGKSADSDTGGTVDIRDSATTLTSVDTNTSNFVRNAILRNVMQVEAGQLGQKQASNADVKAFASTIVTEHTNAIDQLKAIANRKRIEIPVMTSGGGNVRVSGETGKTAAIKHEGGDTSLMNGMENDDRYKNHQRLLDKIRSGKGADFDRQFLQMMVETHQKAISMLEKETQNNDTDIQSFANQMLPVVKKHEATAQALLKNIQN